MALSKIGNNRVIHSQRRKMACNVWKFMKEEALSGIKIPLKCVSSRVVAATGVSKRTLERIKKE
jgi:hypothetical protein